MIVLHSKNLHQSYAHNFRTHKAITEFQQISGCLYDKLKKSELFFHLSRLPKFFLKHNFQVRTVRPELPVASKAWSFFLSYHIRKSNLAELKTYNQNAISRYRILNSSRYKRCKLDQKKVNNENCRHWY